MAWPTSPSVARRHDGKDAVAPERRSNASFSLNEHECVAITAGQELNVDPRPMVLAITFAASASFVTPAGYQTNTLIYGAGDYRFVDFFKVGTPLTLLFGCIAVVALPMIWPF